MRFLNKLMDEHSTALSDSTVVHSKISQIRQIFFRQMCLCSEFAVVSLHKSGTQEKAE